MIGGHTTIGTTRTAISDRSHTVHRQRRDSGGGRVGQGRVPLRLLFSNTTVSPSLLRLHWDCGSPICVRIGCAVLGLRRGVLCLFLLLVPTPSALSSPCGADDGGGHLLRQLLEVQQSIELGHKGHEGRHVPLQRRIELVLGADERLTDGPAMPEQRTVTGDLIAEHRQLQGGAEETDGRGRGGGRERRGGGGRSGGGGGGRGG